ncbi:MAG: type I CRISPR-associated protein Cas7 [Victivallaceae bacterium]|nr:type I CRISPR-associated protein Cas7 [Victivallaceae bacterium]
MIKLQSQLPAAGNAYILFGFEAIQARPNLDPYSGTLRVNDETGQVQLSDVSIKHHVRRGLKAYAKDENLPHAAETVFYEKEDDAAKPCSLKLRLQRIRAAAGIAKPNKKDALNNTVDLPLFGYVQAEQGDNFNVTNAVNTLFRPATFHRCEIYWLGRNNAFSTLDKKNDRVKDSAGSATVDSLEYGFFLSLWEVNLNMLRINAAGNKVINWENGGAGKWIEALVNGMWLAYSNERYPSFTQRSQFAQFVLGWLPDGELSYENPADLYDRLDKKLLKRHGDAVAELGRLLPEFLGGWGCRNENVFVKHQSAKFPVALPGAGA